MTYSMFSSVVNVLVGVTISSSCERTKSRRLYIYATYREREGVSEREEKKESGMYIERVRKSV